MSKLKSFIADDWTDHSEKSWKVTVGATTAFLAKSQCQMGSEPNEFLAPSWLVKRIIKAADETVVPVDRKLHAELQNAFAI